MKTQFFTNDIYASDRAETLEQGLFVHSRNFGRKSIQAFSLIAMVFVFLCATVPAHAQLTYTYPTTKYCPSDPPTSFAGHITHYNLPTAALVNCSMSNDQFDNNHYGAMNQYDWNGSGACGACVSLKGPSASTTLKIVDQCPYVGNETWCYSGSHHIDCAPQVATEVGGDNPAVNWTFIECPLALRTKKVSTGNVNYIWKSGSSLYWGEIAFFDYLFPLVTVKQDYNGTWTTCTRQSYNFFECVGATEAPGNFPCTFALTDARNNSITITTGSSASPIQSSGTWYTTCTTTDSGKQFPSCNSTPVATSTYTSIPGNTATFTRTPTSGNTPIPVACTNFDDFETGTLVSPYTNQPFTPYAFSAGATIKAVTCAGYTGTYALQFGGSGATTDGASGWGLTDALVATGTSDISGTMSYIRFDIRAVSAAAVSMRFNVASSAITTSVEGYWGSNFVAPTTWTAVTLMAANFDQAYGSTTARLAALATATAFQWQCNNQAGAITLQIDNICYGTSQATPTYSFTPTRTPIVTPGTYCPYPYANFDNGVISSYFSNQPWYPYTYGVGVTTAAVTCAGANGTAFGMQFGGSGATTDGVSGWGIANGFGTGVTTNLSTISGISFWIRATTGAAVSMRFNVVSGIISTASEGNWGGSFMAPTAWTCVTILSSAFDQTYTKATPTTKAAALAAATGIQFQDNNQTGSITIQIDEINLLYSGCTPTATFTRTPTITPTSAAGGCWSISNFDAGNVSNSFGYAWNSYPWSTGVVGAATVDNSANAYSGYSLYFAGTNQKADGSDGFAVQTSLGGANISSYFNGLNFMIKTSRAATIRVQLTSTAQSGTNGPYGNTFTTTTAWTLVNIPLASFAQEYGIGGITLAAVLANVNMIQWVSSGNAYTAPLTVWLDNVCISSSITPTIPPTNSPTRTYTITPTASNTGTNTATPASTNTFTRTNTPTNTTTSTPTSTASYTSTPTKTSTPTNTLTITATSTSTNTPNITSTFTWTKTSTPTSTSTATNTATVTWTNTPQFTYTYSNTPTNTSTRSFTPTNTLTSTSTTTPSATPTRTPTVTTTPTWTLTSTLSPTFTNTGAFTGTFTSTSTSTSTNTSTPTKTATPTSTPTNTTGVFTSTFTPTPTFTSTSTRTSTPTNTNTTSVNTATYTSTPTYTSTTTRTSTPTFTFSSTATSTRTWTPTSSFTATWTGTPTVTNTATISYTPTWTVTGTQPLTDTYTVTYTPTHTSTVTNTPTRTWTSTSTSTPTSTLTVTATSTVPAALTSTSTSTPTRTSTATATSTNSSTRTYTVTATSTPTITSTPTDTSTGTLPPTNTFTWTGTPTNTSTVTWTPTDTSTSTKTLTPTSTATDTSTSTSTSTATVTSTITPLFTYTNTNTPTNTSTGTWTGTSTPSSTNTVTASYTSTETSTSTPTWTGTFTNTKTVTATPTSTSTWTGTYSSTPTVTATSTNTFTYTPTYTSTATTSSTATETPVNTAVNLRCKLTVSAPYPNPVVAGQTVKLMLSANPNCPKKVMVAVYSAAYRKIYGSTILVANERGIWEWPVVDSKGAPVASGVYYLRVEEEGVGTVLKWSPVVVLR